VAQKESFNLDLFLKLTYINNILAKHFVKFFKFKENKEIEE
jgi:hypothetical protein